MLDQLHAPSDSKRQPFFLILFLSLYLAWILWGSDQPAQQAWIGHLTLLFTSAYAAYLAWNQALSNTNPDQASAWRWMRAAFFCWLIYRIVFIVAASLSFPGSVLIVTSGLYALGSLFLWIGLLGFSIKVRFVFGKVRLLLDATLTTAALVTMGWLAFFKPFLGAHPGQFLSLSFLTADLITIILFVNLFLLGELKQAFTNLGWMLFGFLAFSLSDLGFLSQITADSYQAGSFIDLGWVLGGIILAYVLDNPNISQVPALKGWLGKSLTRTQALLPIIAVIFLGWYALLNWQLTGTIEILGLWTTLVLGLGLLLRQGLLAGEVNLERYAQLVNSIAEPAFICDRSGLLKMVNPALLEISGYAARQVLGTPLEKLFEFGEQELSWWAQIIREIHQDHFTGSDREVHLICEDAATIPVMLALRPIQAENPQNLALAGTAHDLRLQKFQQSEIQIAYDEVAQAQADLQRLNTGLEQLVNEKTADLQKAYAQLEEQNQQLQQLDQIKSDFVSLVSHELRAPLTNIRGGIELVLSGYIQDPQRINSALNQVQSEILRLSQFTETILDLSALDANRLPLYPEPLHLMTVINALQDHDQHIQQHQRFVWEIPTNLPPILADQKALYSILFHILDNALKYAPQGEITISAKPEAEQLFISVSDHGPGIAEEALPFLFERFYRVNMADAQTIYGHGLGLYLVRRFVTAMGGSVGVQNNPHGGAVFFIRLPLVPG